MDNLLFTAMSGASRVLQAQQVRSNNLSNADTSGFRADLERVQSLPLEGTGFAGRTQVVSNSAMTNFSTGSLIKTGRALDIAISGEGFLAVQNAIGAEAYTRAGNINVDNAGAMTINGFPLLNEGGEVMVLPDHESVSVSERGIVSVTPPGGQAEIQVGVIKRVNPDLTLLAKQDDGLLYSADNQPFAEDAGVQIAPEHIEGSNVSAIDELIGVMSLTRNFEMQIRMMKTAETLAQAGTKLMSAR